MHIRPFIISAASMAICLSCNVNREREQMESLETITKQELATALEERDELLSLVKEVSSGLKQLKELEHDMSLADTIHTPSRNAQIIADISTIKKNILKRKERLNQLEEKLSNSTINNQDLKETIEAIRLQMDAQIDLTEQFSRKLNTANKRIGSLSRTVDSLNNTVNEVSGQRDMAINRTTRLEDEMNICYYVADSKRELKNNGIIETGFLRKTQLMKGNFDKECFTVADKRTLLSIPINSAKIHILTTHPIDSYSIAKENDRTVIHILDPISFWSLSNYLVVQTD